MVQIKLQVSNVAALWISARIQG